MSKKLCLYPEPRLQLGPSTQRRCTVELIDGAGASKRDTLYFEVPSDLPLPPDDEMDSFVTAVAMWAMAERCPLHIAGDTCHDLLMNLTEYAAAWAKWVPQDYGTIDLRPERVRTGDTVPNDGRAIAAYSGGVDAMFLVWAHHNKRRGFQNREISHCMFVHGFDIPLAADEQYAIARRQAAETIGSLGLSLLPIRTNFRQVVPTRWPHVFAAAVAASFHSLSRVAGSGLIGSSEPYDRLIFPWGCGPITDRLLSTRRMAVVHDGAAYSRTEKVKGIADWNAGLKQLRVCWEGADKSRNCGRCEKCVRTQLNFAVNGEPVPESLGGKLNPRRFWSIRLKNAPVFEQYQSIYRLARKRRLRAPWVFPLRLLLLRERVRLWRKTTWLRLKPTLKRVLAPVLARRAPRPASASFPVPSRSASAG